MLHVIPSLSDLLTDISQASTVPPEAVPEMLGELERLKATLWARLTALQGNGRQPDKDRLLVVEEAAVKLGVSRDYLYRYSGKLPFTVRVGRSLRFSEAGVDRYIRNRTGR